MNYRTIVTFAIFCWFFSNSLLISQSIKNKSYTISVSQNLIIDSKTKRGVNLQMACRIVGDNLPLYEGAKITVLPMTIQPFDDANDAELQLQVMLTSGEAIKGDAKSGMLGNYFELKVFLKVYD